MLLQRGHSRKILASHSSKKSINYRVFIIRGIAFKSSHSHKNDISVACNSGEILKVSLLGSLCVGRRMMFSFCSPSLLLNHGADGLADQVAG